MHSFFLRNDFCYDKVKTQVGLIVSFYVLTSYGHFWDQIYFWLRYSLSRSQNKRNSDYKKSVAQPALHTLLIISAFSGKKPKRLWRFNGRAVRFSIETSYAYLSLRTWLNDSRQSDSHSVRFQAIQCLLLFLSLLMISVVNYLFLIQKYVLFLQWPLPACGDHRVIHLSASRCLCPSSVHILHLRYIGIRTVSLSAVHSRLPGHWYHSICRIINRPIKWPSNWLRDDAETVVSWPARNFTTTTIIILRQAWQRLQVSVATRLLRRQKVVSHQVLQVL